MDSAKNDAIKEMTSRKVALGSFNYDSALCVVSGGNGYRCFNTPSGLNDWLKKINSRGGTVQIIRLFSDGKYYIKDDQSWQAALPFGDMQAEIKKNKKVEDISVADDGSWIIIYSDSFVSSRGVDSDLTGHINDFFRQQRERKQKRQREINEYNNRERAAQEAREAAERERREAAERAAREEEQRRAEEETKRREEEERARKAAEEESRATILEVKLVEKLTQEKESIDKLETKLEVMQGHLGAMQDHFSTMQDDLYSRKRSLRESIVALPPAQRPRWNLEDDKPIKRQEKPLCVICHDKTPVWAVVPCGHLCLCDDCAPSILQGPSYDRLCPLCRGTASSTLRIYS